MRNAPPARLTTMVRETGSGVSGPNRPKKTVDGDTTEYTTPGHLSLSAGTHKVHFSNPELHLDKDVMIDVPAKNGFTWAGKLQD